MINVLVTSIGSNTSIGVVKALRKDREIVVTGIDIFPAHLCAGSSMVDFFYTVPQAASSAYESQLLKIIKEKEIHCVIPVHDVELMVVSLLAAKFPGLTGWAVNNPDLISQCNNKKTINRFLASQEIDVPEMYETVSGMEFPAIYKLNQGVSSRGQVIIENIGDAGRLFDMDNGFFQRWVRGNEYTVDCYSGYKNAYFNCCVRKRIETKDGMSTKGETIDFPLLVEKSAEIHRLLQYRGASNIQFIVEDGIPYFIEINPRFSGGGILSVHAGLNSPLLTVLDLTNSRRFSDLGNLPVRAGVFMTRYWEEIFYEE